MGGLGRGGVGFFGGRAGVFCLFLKGLFENFVFLKEEVKGLEVGGWKRGYEREVEIIVNTEVTDVYWVDVYI